MTLPASHRRMIGFAVLAVASWPGAAEACSVCFSGEDASRIAFIVTTGLLTFLPLLLIGGVIYTVRRRALRLEAERSGGVSS